MKSILLEAVVVGAAGAILALAANALSPRGLALGRDYFQQTQPPDNSVSSSTNATATLTEREHAEARLRQKGLQIADTALAARLFHDPRYQQGTLIFIDARNDEHYGQGHIPGAYQFDYYHPAGYLSTVLPACQAAEQILVYCTGGNCEDSEFAATFLRDAGVPAQKLYVYTGGISDWTSNSLPVETGQRNSGLLQEKPK